METLPTDHKQSVVKLQDEEGQEPSKVFRNNNIAEMFDTDIRQSEDFQKFLIKYRNQQHMTPKLKKIIQLQQCPYGQSPEIETMHIPAEHKHKKSKLS